MKPGGQPNKINKKENLLEYKTLPTGKKSIPQGILPQTKSVDEGKIKI
jgi:hypothetical protein